MLGFFLMLLYQSVSILLGWDIWRAATAAAGVLGLSL